MALLVLASTILAAQVFLQLPTSEARHVWESWRLQVFPEVLADNYTSSTTARPGTSGTWPTSSYTSFSTYYPNPYDQEASHHHTHPGLHQTGFYTPPQPPFNKYAACQWQIPIDRLISFAKYGNLNVSVVSVQYDTNSRFLEYRMFVKYPHQLTYEGQRLVDNSGTIVTRRTVPLQCMFITHDHVAGFSTTSSFDEDRYVKVRLSPEVFAVFLPSLSAVAAYTVAPGMDIDATFAEGGFCLLVTRVAIPPGSLVVEASLRELRIKAVLGEDRYRLLRLYRWADCRCAPQKFREIAYWVIPEEHGSLIVVHTGRTPGVSDSQRCQVQPLPRLQSSSDQSGFGVHFDSSPLFAP